MKPGHVDQSVGQLFGGQVRAGLHDRLPGVRGFLPRWRPRFVQIVDVVVCRFRISEIGHPRVIRVGDEPVHRFLVAGPLDGGRDVLDPARIDQTEFGDAINLKSASTDRRLDGDRERLRGILR